MTFATVSNLLIGVFGLVSASIGIWLQWRETSGRRFAEHADAAARLLRLVRDVTPEHAGTRSVTSDTQSAELEALLAGAVRENAARFAVQQSKQADNLSHHMFMAQGAAFGVIAVVAYSLAAHASDVKAASDCIVGAGAVALAVMSGEIAFVLWRRFTSTRAVRTLASLTPPDTIGQEIRDVAGIVNARRFVRRAARTRDDEQTTL